MFIDKVMFSDRAMFMDKVMFSDKAMFMGKVMFICLVIGLRLGMWICYNLVCSLLKHIVSLTIISGSPFKHGKHRVA